MLSSQASGNQHRAIDCLQAPLHLPYSPPTESEAAARRHTPAHQDPRSTLRPARHYRDHNHSHDHSHDHAHAHARAHAHAHDNDHCT